MCSSVPLLRDQNAPGDKEHGSRRPARCRASARASSAAHNPSALLSSSSISSYALFTRPLEASRACRQLARASIVVLRLQSRRLANDTADLRYAGISLCSCAPPCEEQRVRVCVPRFGACILYRPTITRTRLRGSPPVPRTIRPSALPRHEAALLLSEDACLALQINLATMKHGTPSLLNPANKRKVILSHAHLGISTLCSACERAIFARLIGR